MKILFLHGWTSTPGGLKPTYLKSYGHEVLNPALPDDDFEEAVRIAQAEFDLHKPHVVVGSSRGGALAMDIDSGDTPLVLLCPAWKRWGTATTVKPGTLILHSKTDETVPLADSQELRRNSGLPDLALVVVGQDHRLADPEPLKAMLEACLRSRPRVAGCDFGVPKTAGDQARKIILIEAIWLGDRRYAIEPTGRNARLVHEATRGSPWKERRRGWTLPELADSLSADRSVKAVAFDFPFSIPLSLLRDSDFARRMGRQRPFGTRERWAGFVESRLGLAFEDGRAGAEVEDLGNFGPWRDKAFWQRRATDVATSGSPPLKHRFQNVFAMTLAGNALLSHLAANGYTTVLDPVHAPADQCVFETYPRAVANQIGFAGSYKRNAARCLGRALGFLHERSIRLDFDEQVRQFCLEYRTSGNDPDGADAFLCLIAAIAFHEGMVEICAGGADAATLREEGAVIVPACDPADQRESAV
jgi:hypothetical protein